MTKQCELWPECGCYHTLARWKKNLEDEDTIWTTEQLAWAECTIFIHLCCILRHCPDRVIKSFAEWQLNKSFWDREKAKGQWQ